MASRRADLFALAGVFALSSCAGGGSNVAPSGFPSAPGGAVLGSARDDAGHGARLVHCIPKKWHGRKKLDCPSLPPGIPANYDLSRLPRVSLPQVYPKDEALRFLPVPTDVKIVSATRRSARSTIRSYDSGGQLGIRMYDQGAPVAIRVAHSYWDPQSVALSVPPSDAVDTQGNPVTADVLYAPTTKISGGCYEDGSDYFRGTDGTTTGYFRTYNFCNPSGGNPGTFDSSVDLSIGSPFESQYVFTATGQDGTQREYYAFEIAKMSDGKYHTLLFDPGPGTYGDYQVAAPVVPPTVLTGWSIFETHYAGSTASTTEYCPPEQPFTSDALAIASDPNGPYTNVDYTKYSYTTGDCTVNDMTYGAYYLLTVGGTYWRVDYQNSF